MSLLKRMFQSHFLHYCSRMTNCICFWSSPISPRWRSCRTGMENLNCTWFRQVSQTLWCRITPAIVEIYPQNQSKSFGRVYLCLGMILNILQNQSPTRFCRRRSREKYILSGWIEIVWLRNIVEALALSTSRCHFILHAGIWKTWFGMFFLLWSLLHGSKLCIYMWRTSSCRNRRIHKLINCFSPEYSIHHAFHTSRHPHGGLLGCCASTSRTWH